MDKRLKFNEPWILQRADPYVYEKDGWYYFTASELHYLEGKWYSYFAGGEEENIWKIRCFVFRLQETTRKLSGAYNISKRSKEIWQS